MSKALRHSIKAIQDFINLVERLDLLTYPIDEIELAIKNIVPIPRLVILIHKGERVFRGRYMDNEEFINAKDFSYNPVQKSIGRANLSGSTCFYGCLETHLLDSTTPVVYELGLKERMSLLPVDTFHKTKIGISCWEFTEDIYVELSGFNCSDYFGNGTDLERLCKKYFKELKQFYHSEDLATVMKYFLLVGTEFTKKKEVADFEYLISAVYSRDTMNEPGISGIAYPSKQVNGMAMNIALKPSVADAILKFVNVTYTEVHSYNHVTVMAKTKESFPYNGRSDRPILFRTYQEYDTEYFREQLLIKHEAFLKLKEKTSDNKEILKNFHTQINEDGSKTKII